MLIEFTCNGKPVAVEAPPDISLLTLLRDYLGLTGSKEGCSVGECGACSVIMDGRLVNSCLVLAPQAGGSEIITIEGVHGGSRRRARTTCRRTSSLTARSSAASASRAW